MAAKVAAPSKRCSGKRQMEDNTELLPATRPRLSDHSVPGKAEAWQEPKRSLSVQVWEEMSRLIPWLQQSLPQGLAGNVTGYGGCTSLAALEPGKIQSLDESVSASFREAWSCGNCQASLQKHNQYEAAGCLWWLQLYPDERGVTPFDNLDWESLCEFAEGFGPLKVENGFVPFNIIVPAYRFKADSGLHDWSSDFPTGLSVCQGALLPCWALLLAISRAFLAQDWSHLDKLMACSRSIPIRLQIVPDGLALAKMAINFSTEHMKASLMEDTFTSWLSKFPDSGKAKDMVAWLKSNKVFYYDGKTIQDPLLKAAKLGLQYLFDEKVAKQLCLLQRVHGRKLLTKEYTKLYRFLGTLQSLMKKLEKDPSSDVLAWALQYTHIALQREWLEPSSVTADNLGDGGKSKSVTWGMSVFLKHAVVAQIADLIPGICKDDNVRSELETVTETFLDLDSFEKLLPKIVSEDSERADSEMVDDEKKEQTGTEAAPDETSGDSPFEEYVGKLTASSRCLATFLFELLSGEMEQEFHDHWLSSDNMAKALKEVLLVGSEEEETSWTQGISKFMNEMELLHTVALESKASSSFAAPPPKLRELVRALSDPGDVEKAAEKRQKREKERQTLWSSCLTHRAKFLRVLTSKGRSSSQILDMVCGCSLYKAHQASPKARVLLIFAADLAGESKGKPWVGTWAKPTTVPTEVDARLDCMKKLSGKDHFCSMVFDGRSKSWRGYLESKMGGSEIFLVFSGRPNEGTVGSRQIPFSSNTREVAFLECSFPKTRMYLQEHQLENIMESSSHYSHWSGLNFPGSLPKIKPEVKESILGNMDAPEAWPMERGLPLFWQESKPKSFWSSLYSSLGVTLIVDFEIGSGQAALAAMEDGLSYVGLCKDQSHNAWVSNYLDKQALRLITTTGHSMFSETLATALQEIFSTET
ncbi:Cdkl4 [Symbiodinium sp. CCMP2592]|nr:Cdkl4 [Symbiodinium sp. CCMP2592]